tara:strand:+ start:12107 stop:12364 length:258 start_codon:yes stop_codon:yes gene_type:complete
MTLYKCECGNSKELQKATMKIINNKVVVAEALCKCGLYMDSEPTDGIPNLKRTEASLSKKKRGDKLWDSAKEKLIGERGINEPFK